MNRYFWEGFEKQAAGVRVPKAKVPAPAPAPGPVRQGLESMWSGAKNVGSGAKDWVRNNPLKSVAAGTAAGAGAGYMAGRPSQAQSPSFQNVQM